MLFLANQKLKCVRVYALIFVYLQRIYFFIILELFVGSAAALLKVGSKEHMTLKNFTHKKECLSVSLLCV